MSEDLCTRWLFTLASSTPTGRQDHPELSDSLWLLSCAQVWLADTRSSASAWFSRNRHKLQDIKNPALPQIWSDWRWLKFRYSKKYLVKQFGSSCHNGAEEQVLQGLCIGDQILMWLRNDRLSVTTAGLLSTVHSHRLLWMRARLANLIANFKFENCWQENWTHFLALWGDHVWLCSPSWKAYFELGTTHPD